MYCHTKWECGTGIISYLLHHSVVKLEFITDTNNVVQRMGKSTFVPQKFDNHTKLIESVYSQLTKSNILKHMRFSRMKLFFE